MSDYSYEFLERCSIIEYEAGLSKEKAEAQTRSEWVKRLNNNLPLYENDTHIIINGIIEKALQSNINIDIIDGVLEVSGDEKNKHLISLIERHSFKVMDNIININDKTSFDTDAGLIQCTILENNHKNAFVKVNMGKPILNDPSQVTISASSNGIIKGKVESFNFTFVSMGNPHAVIFFSFLKLLASSKLRSISLFINFVSCSTVSSW